MRRLRSWVLRLASLFGAGRPDADIIEELEAHRELLAAEYRRSGMSADESRRRAAADFGSVPAAAEACQDRRGVPTLEGAVRDGRMALRSLSRTPALSLAMVLVLGLGIGLSTAIVAVFHAIVWAELPVASPASVVRITQRFDGTFDRRVQGQVSRFSYPELETYRRSTRAMAAVAGVSYARTTWRRETEVRSLQAARVTGDYFRVLGVSPVVGRTLTEADVRQSVAVISHRLWTDALGANADVIGHTMRLDRTAYTIVGVAPQSFFGTEVDPVAVWLPLEVAMAAQGNEAQLSERNVSWLQLLARLAPDQSIATAQVDGALIAAQLDQDYPGRRTTIGIARASRLDTGAVGTSNEAGKILTVSVVVGAILGLLFLICGSNAAALLLARGAARYREVAVRVALGATRAHLVRQLMAEVGTIAITSAGLGLLVCFGTLQGLATRMPMQDLLLSIQADWRVFGFALGTAFAVAALFGIAPAHQALQVDCVANLKGEGSVVGGRVLALRFRRALIAVQVTVSVVLLVAAAVLGRGVSQAWRANLGYSTAGLYVVKWDANWKPDERPDVSGGHGVRLAEALTREPGIRAVSQAALAPFYGTGISQAGPSAAEPLQPVHFNQVDERYFATLSIPLLAGRMFLPGEDDAVVINAALARRFWTDERSAIGRTLFIQSDAGRRRPVSVVGIVPTVQTTEIGIPDQPTYYTFLTEQDARTAFLLVRSDGSVPLRSLVSQHGPSVDPDTVALVTALDAHLLESTGARQIGMGVAGLIGFLALVVAAVGIHGVIAYTVSCRTREIGVYRALGATPAHVLRLILGWTLKGVAIGLAGALSIMAVVAAAFGSQMRGLLNGLHPLDPVSFALGSAVLLCVIGVAAFLPARRALGMAPVAALRGE